LRRAPFRLRRLLKLQARVVTLRPVMVLASVALFVIASSVSSGVGQLELRQNKAVHNKRSSEQQALRAKPTSCEPRDARSNCGNSVSKRIGQYCIRRTIRPQPLEGLAVEPRPRGHIPGIQFARAGLGTKEYFFGAVQQGTTRWTNLLRPVTAWVLGGTFLTDRADRS